MKTEQNLHTLKAGQCLAAHYLNQCSKTAVRFLLTALSFGVLISGVARAQNGGEITGTVTDPTGAIVPNVDVKVTSVETGSSHVTKTNGAGIFDFPGLDNGNYNLSASYTGFQAYRKDGIVLNIAETLREDINLAVGSASQEVVVQSNALQVQSETSEVSSLISGQQISQLATNGRNVTSLAALGTGVSGNLPSFNGVTAQGSTATLSFNGTNPNHNNWLIDGGEVYDRGSGGKLDVLPSPDVISEFQVLASNYPPDYGINSGGTIVMQLKSGTKQFHGGLWEFVRNDDLDAGYYFNKQADTPSPELRLNIFGGDIGGPVWIPKVYNSNKDKTFFFWSEEWRKYIQGANASAQNTIPAQDFPTAGSNFTYTQWNCAPSCPSVLNPATGTPFQIVGTPAASGQPNTYIIPAASLDANAVLFMNTGAIPKPNVNPNGNSPQYIASPRQPTDVREDTVRVDHNITDKLHLVGSYIHDQMSQTYFPPQWSGVTYTTVGNVFANPSWAAVVKLSQTISPTMLNEVCLCVNGNTISTQPQGIYAEPSGWSAGSFFTGNNAQNRLPQVQFENGQLNTTWGASYWPWHNSYLNYQLRDDFSWTRGRHSMKYGFAYMRMDKNQQQQADTQGDYTFNGGTGVASQDPYINFLLGYASTYQQLNALKTNHWLNNTYSFYAMDNWHIMPRLTLNLGIRYDGMPRVYEKNNLVANFNPAAFNPADEQAPNASSGNLSPTGPGFSQPAGATNPFYLNGIQLAGSNGVPRGLIKNDYFTWQPRLGFAYDLFGNGKTVVRGGIGVFYERVQGNDIYDIDTTPPNSYQPKASNVRFSSPTTSWTGAVTPPSSLPSAPASVSSLANYYPNPATTQYSFGVQREIAPSVVFGVQYVGTTAWNQNTRVEQNDLPLANLTNRQAVAQGANANLYRPYLGYSNILQSTNAVNSNYNSFQTALRMEKRHGLTLQLAYTWSHEIDGQQSSQDLGTASNPYNLGYDRGSGAFDRRNIFSANYVYDVPFFNHSGSYLERATLGGWQISGITVAESGSNIVGTGYSNGLSYNGPDVIGAGGNTTNRPNQVAPVSYPHTQKAWFSTSSFAAPAAPWTAAGAGGTGFGDARKDAVVGPGLFNWNIALFKDFPIHEAISLQFRAESFNTFNHTQFNEVDGGTNDANFGQVTSTQDPRVFQFGAKLLF
jgi:Carboxypeptidase regulatory-like domain